VAAASAPGGVGFASVSALTRGIGPGVYLRSACPMLPAPPRFWRLKIVLGSLGIESGAGGLPGLGADGGVLVGSSAMTMRLAWPLSARLAVCRQLR
jgi:hypothetical protein